MSKNPQLHLMIFAGPNGTGKTTLALDFLKKYPKLNIDIFVNTDEIARGLSPINPENQKVEAGKIALKKRESLLENRKNFAFETTLAGKREVKFLKKARKCGYIISMIYLYTSDVEINIGRVRTRVLQEGHDVPEADIRRRYERSLKNFINTYIELCDIITVYDASKEYLLPVYTKFLKTEFIKSKKRWKFFERFKDEH